MMPLDQGRLNLVQKTGKGQGEKKEELDVLCSTGSVFGRSWK